MKNYRKLFAWLMTLIMLLGMVPAASASMLWCPDDGLEHNWGPAEYPDGTCGWGMHWCTRCGAGDEVPPQHKWVTSTLEEPTCTYPGWKESFCSVCGDEKGDGQEIPPLGHDWGTDKVDHPGNCLLPGLMSHMCKRCNTREEWEIAYGDHSWGEWRVTKQGDCRNPGEEARTCSICGQRQTRTTVGDHAFGAWKDTKAPTCTEPGRREHVCSRCGYNEWGIIRQLDHVFGAWYVVTPAQIGVAGLEQRDCTYGCGTYEQRQIPALEPDGSSPVGLQGLNVYKQLITPPTSESGMFEAGQEISYMITVENKTGVDLFNLEISDPLRSGRPVIATYKKMPAGQGVTVNFHYTITDADAANGSVVNTAYATGATAEGLTVSGTSNTVTTPVGTKNGAGNIVTGTVIPTEPTSSAGLSVSHTYTNTPANGEYFTPGEVIDYLITVTNTGSVMLMNLYVGNASSEAVIPSPREIAPGQTIQVPYYKLVYEDDAKAGGINSYAHAQAFSGEPATIENMVDGRSAELFVPCGMSNGSPSVYYLKTVNTAPANGLFFTEGETIKYRLSFGNNTKKDIYNITLNDPMANTRSVAFARRLKAGEFLMGEFEYVVTAADVEAGQIVNTGTSTWATKAEGAQTKTPSNTVVTPCGVPGADSVDAMLEKYVTNEPANGEYFVPGETIEYAVIFMNVCPHELHDVEVFDPLKGSNEDITIAREPIVEPNGTLYLSFSYIVTEEDAARGTVVNTASALWLNPEIEEWSSCDSNTVVTDVGMPEGVHLIKTIENAPANGQFFVPGEVINFVITVQNSMGKTLDVVVLTDPLSADFYHELLDIPGGAVDSRTFRYTVTELDASIGSVNNCAYAVAYADGNPRSLTSNTVTAPCGFPDNDGDGQPDDIYGIHICLEVTKEVESLPMNGSYYTEGETVAYKISYVNAGEMPLTDVMIYDSMGGLTEIATAETLQPSESRVCWFNHTVSAADVARGYISNTAIGQFELSGFLNTVSSNTVVVDTDGQADTVTGGNIDLDMLRTGDDTCKQIITARDNVSVSYDTSFCSVHTPIHEAVLAVHKANGATPEMQLQADTYAVTLWRSAAEKIYADIFTAADPMAKATVMNEYIRFQSMVANQEAILKALCPDQPALVAHKIAEIWEEKCVTLCYETHASAAERKDSLLSVAAASGASAAECACTITAEQSSLKSAKTTYCPMHAFPFSMTDTFLMGRDTAEAWAAMRQVWNVELTKAYNLLSIKLGDKFGLAMAEQAVLTQWLAAREASLTALYPDNPELVAQIMTKTIMDRVNDLCQLVK